jgi:hypothetical protein
LYPDSLAVVQDVRNLPLHTACQLGSADTIAFLMDQHPQALSCSNSSDQYPIHILLERKYTESNDTFEELVQKAVEYCPQSCYFDNDTFKRPLELAIEKHWDPSLIAFLAQGTGTHLKRLSLGKRSPTAVSTGFLSNLDLAKSVAAVLPLLELTRFDCFPDSWTRSGFIHMMKTLEASPSIQTLGLDLPKTILKNDFEAPDSLQEMLAGNNLIRELVLSGRSPSSEEDDGAILRTVMDGISENDAPAFQSIALDHFGFGFGALVTFLSDKSAPRSISLDNIQPLCLGQTPDQGRSACQLSASVESLTIRFVKVNVARAADIFWVS